MDTLFIVNSPLQCLCMFEAISYFNIERYDVIFRPDVVENNNVKVETLLKSKGIAYERIGISHIVYDVLPYFFKKNKKYDTFFIGDYYEGGITAYAISLIIAKPNAKIYYLDDGSGTLAIFCENPPKRYPNVKVQLVMAFYGLIKLLKRIEEPIFFTYFDVSSKKYKIIRNTFDSLRPNNSASSQGVYIIGANSSSIPFEDHSYLDYLSRLAQYVTDKCPNQPIYYCPHRRDANMISVLNHCEKLGFILFDTKVSVEYDFATQGINPLYIVGFASSALYSLKMIFPASVVETIEFHFTDTTMNEWFVAFFKGMNEFGIKSVKLF